MRHRAAPLVMVPLVRELGGVALRDTQAAIGEVELVGRLREDLQHEGLEAGHLHALGQRADERERLELHQRRAAHLLEQRDGEGGRAVGVREQLLPQLAVARPLHELDGARHVPPVLEHQLERLAVEAHTPQHKDLRGIRVQPGVMAAAAHEYMGLQPGRMRLQPRAR